MTDRSYDFERFDSLFYPKHIAFIGASENSALGSMLFLPAFKDSLWEDTFYPVNPKREKVLHWKSYSSVLDIPYPVDTAYVSLKTKFIPQVMRECVEKKVRWVIIFASGFSETGNPEGKKLEQEVCEIIKDTETRVVGPNCLGPFNGSTGMTFAFNAVKGLEGSISFMSQSGGHLNQLLDVGYKRDIRFRYGISFGNQIDINCLEMMRHYYYDPKTEIIVAYLESFGSANGHEVFLELKKIAKEKPVIIWKGGHTEDGSRAAFSHTGAIASNARLWESLSKQTGAIITKDNEEWWNTMKTFELLYPRYMPNGRNVGIITPGGGSSVNMTDLFASHDLRVPTLTQESQEEISRILPDVNVIVENPIDLGASGFVLDMFLECVKVVVEDPNIDIIVIPLWSNHIYHYVFKRMTEIQKSTSKPFVFCLPSMADDEVLSTKFAKCKKVLHKNRSLYFLTLRDAGIALSKYCDYIEFLKSRDLIKK